MGRGSYRSCVGALAPARWAPAAPPPRFALPSLLIGMLLAACERSPSPAASGANGRAAAAPSTPASGGGAATSAKARDEARRAAESYLSEGRLDEALVITTRLVRIAPEGPFERELHARVLLSRALLEPAASRTAALLEAAAEYGEASRLDPRNAALEHATGVVYDQAGRLDEALPRYRRAAELDPTNPQHPLYTGLALRRVGRLDDALAALDAAKALDADEPQIAVARADALLALGRADEALVEARRARTLASADLAARVAEARALRALDRPRDAAELLLMLDDATIANEAVAQELAGALLAIDEPEQAARAWERSLAVDPRRWRSAMGAAEAWLATGDIIRASERASLAASMAPRAERDGRVRELEDRIRAASAARASPP